MSCWTHITACISIETGIVEKRPELKRRLKKYIENAPKITGSERDADIFINIKTGHNFWTSKDCDHCKYANTLHDVIEDGEEYSKCDGPENYKCSAEYQTHAVITVQGDLRDRTKKQTQTEWDAFLKYIETDNFVRDYSVNIEGDY